jgi:hypothetical protein
MERRVFLWFSVPPHLKDTPEKLPVHGLNVFAFARIQTSSNGGFAPKRETKWID